MKTRTIAAAAIIAASAWGAPACAASFQFFEGNNCTQAALGAINHEQLAGYTGRSLVPGQFGWNDEARSVLIRSNWRTTVEPRQMDIEIFDSPEWSKDDDWVKIVVKDAMLIPPEGVCVKSFERPFNRDGVYIELHPNNGLDGKVSRISLNCDAACYASKTALPVPPTLEVTAKKGTLSERPPLKKPLVGDRSLSEPTARRLPQK